MNFAKEEMVVLIFSKDRAMQLDALLSSMYLHCQDPELLRPQVLFTCSAERHLNQYRQLAESFSRVYFIAETDFAGQLSATVNSAHKILFLVDDAFFVGGFSVRRLLALLDQHHKAVGVSLRLGKNTRYCYPLRSNQTVPRFQRVGDGFLCFDWTVAEGDFGYPLEVSSSCYRTEDVVQVLRDNRFKNPNELEGVMAANVRKPPIVVKRFLLCPEQSLAFSNPVNIVQNSCSNRYEPAWGYTAESLADFFAQGRRIDVEAYRDFRPSACHQPVKLFFR